jgi:hypothetical protein
MVNEPKLSKTSSLADTRHKSFIILTQSSELIKHYSEIFFQLGQILKSCKSFSQFLDYYELSSHLHSCM